MKTLDATRRGEAVRRAILARLDAGPATLRELAEGTGSTGSTLLHHLGVLSCRGEVRRVRGARPKTMEVVP